MEAGRGSSPRAPAAPRCAARMVPVPAGARGRASRRSPQHTSEEEQLVLSHARAALCQHTLSHW